MSRAQLTSTVEQSSGGVVAPFLAGKNKIINGDCAINQRNITSTGVTYGFGYTLDQWQHYWTSGTATISAQPFTAGTAPVAGYEAKQFYRAALTGIGTTTNDSFALQFNVEGVRTLANQTATVSFWCKTASGTPNIGVSINQNFGSGGSSGTFTGKTVTLSGGTSWTRYSVTFAIPSISGQTIGTSDMLTVYFVLQAGAARNAIFGTSASNSANTFDLWGVQLEAGSVATPFTTASNTLQGELALCQRYYQRINFDGGTQYSLFGQGIASTSSNVVVGGWLPVYMRVHPSSIDYSAGLYVADGQSAISVSSLTLDTTSSPNATYQMNAAVSGATQYRFYYMRGSLTTNYLGFSAEL